MTMETTPNPRWRKPRVNIGGTYYKCSELISYTKFASRLGLKADAYRRIIEEGLGPEPAPVRPEGINSFWCRNDMAALWWQWLRDAASEEQIARVAEIVRESDLRHWDYWAICEGESVRAWLLGVLEYYTPEKWHKAMS